MGGSPGLVVMGGNSCSKGCRFKYWMDIFIHLFVVKIVNVCLKKTKKEKKMPRMDYFYLKKTYIIPNTDFEPA